MSNTAMSQRIGSPGLPAQGREGSSWAHILDKWFVRILILILLVLSIWLNWWSYVLNIPIYWLVGVVGALFWSPYFVAVHRARQTELVVYERPNRLTLYRVGKKSKGFSIAGTPINMTSLTGYRRIYVTSYDVETNTAEGSHIKGYSTLDYLAEISTFDKLSTKFTEHIEEDRICKELVGVRVAENVRDHASKWVEIGIASQSPEPIMRELEALDLLRATDQDQTSLDVDEVLDDV